jgi:hypothetical protein
LKGSWFIRMHYLFKRFLHWSDNVIIAMFVLLMVAGCSSSAVKIRELPASAPSWKGACLDNGIVSMCIVPGIGGRVLQYRLGDYGFFWVNPLLEGREPPESRVGPGNVWLNYGGDKLWISPQGWNGAHQWSGPPDAVLDGGAYRMEVARHDDKAVSVKLTSQKDERSGVQLSRIIRMFEGTTRVSIDASMKNIDSKPRRWSIWAHTQFDASNRKAEQGYNRNYWGYCPLNRNSLHERGFNVLFGRAENPGYKPDQETGIMSVHYVREVGKIGVDCDAGWVATVDGTAGKVFVQRFKFEPDKVYPNKASVEFWMQGYGEIEAYNRTIEMGKDEVSNPHIFESELVGPYVELKPGQTTTFHYDWYAATIGGNYQIIDCSETGVICEPIKMIRQDSKLLVSGRFGVFMNGVAKLVFIGDDNRKLAEMEVGKVSPLNPLVLDMDFEDERLLDARFVQLVVDRSMDGKRGWLAK